MIGLERGVVKLVDHDPEWEVIAADTIKRLWDIFGPAAKDIQHVGSTAITHIKAKPIIDIAVVVDDFDVVMELVSVLKENGFIYRKRENHKDESLLFACGDYSKSDGIITHFIHVVKSDGEEFVNYLRFRDYMNTHIDEAKAYETLKLRLMNENPIDPGREKYLAGKKDFITEKLMLARLWDNFERKFIEIEPITKGWSEDKKYCVTVADGTKYLLRITPISCYETRKSLFTMLEQVAALDIPMCTPVEFGTCDDGVYALHSWIDGEDLETVLSRLSETEQYILGLKSGEILRKMHTVPAPDTQEEWEVRFNRKADAKIKRYHECGFQFNGDDKILVYLEQNRDLLKNRPQCFQHGDYHVGNMMVENGELRIIDFDRYDFGDPWEEFNRIVWSAAASPHFATGQLRGYFGGEPPLEFFKLLLFYIASNTLSSVSWAISFGHDETDTMLNQAKDILQWFNNMQNPVPTWYLKDFHVQCIDGVPYKLKAPFDFSFISKYGKVFKVFDEQGSGNIAFGVENGGKKYFIKFAGSPKPNYIANRDNGEIDAASAVELLKSAVPLYTELSHPTLIKFISSEEIGGGYAAVFEWETAIGIEPKDSPDYMRFMQMPIEKKMQAFEDIVEFHTHVAAKGYVALDFYDGSILYDYDKEKVIICDIDLYQKSPFINAESLGIVGSARYVSPEECVQDAVMDEITNVYTMGAAAFALFAYGDRSKEAWQLNMALYDVVNLAVSDDRNLRQQSIEQFIYEWQKAKTEKI